ncbi:perlucin-like [Palaemon carinicauda]|uniref:perlucin-like n=1 Tax=Palaemon carinicauda TaxID=392227 RepID=UPI0035B67CB2
MLARQLWLNIGFTLLIVQVVYNTRASANIFRETFFESFPEDDYERSDFPEVKVQEDQNSPERNLRTSNEEPTCPPPFFQVMFECFYIHVHHHLTWWQARDFCRDMGGDLAEPSHPSALIAVVMQKHGTGPYHFWLGASDLKQQGNFTWLSGNPVDSGWRPGQPDNEGGVEDCLELWPSKYPSYCDKNCYSPCAFICQYLE